MTFCCSPASDKHARRMLQMVVKSYSRMWANSQLDSRPRRTLCRKGTTDLSWGCTDGTCTMFGMHVLA